jgi:hypothetical protein
MRFGDLGARAGFDGLALPEKLLTHQRNQCVCPFLSVEKYPVTPDVFATRRHPRDRRLERAYPTFPTGSDDRVRLVIDELGAVWTQVGA